MSVKAGIEAPVSRAEGDYERFERATEGIEAPFALVDLDAMWSNSDDMLRRSAGKPIRVASKSVRSRPLLERILARDAGYRGLLTYTLPESLWLAREGFEDLVVGYPTVDRTAIDELARLTDTHPGSAPVLMVDSTEHLDLIEAAAGGGDAPIRLALELDVGYWPLGGRLKIGPKRSPIRTPRQAADLAREIGSRPRLRLVGLMAYEGHIAGLGDRPPGETRPGSGDRVLQSRSAHEIRDRRAAVVAAVSDLAQLEFVNGGGTGSLHGTTGEDAVTEAGRRLGLLRPHPVRRLQLVSPAPRGDVRDAGRAQARPLDRDRARRRVPRVGSRRAQPGPLPPPPRQPAPRPVRGRGRGPDAGARRGARVTCESATVSTSGTRRRASCASASRRSTSCPATGSWTRCRPTAARGRRSSK